LVSLKRFNVAFLYLQSHFICKVDGGLTGNSDPDVEEIGGHVGEGQVADDHLLLGAHVDQVLGRDGAPPYVVVGNHHS